MDDDADAREVLRHRRLQAPEERRLVIDPALEEHRLLPRELGVAGVAAVEHLAVVERGAVERLGDRRVVEGVVELRALAVEGAQARLRSVEGRLRLEVVHRGEAQPDGAELGVGAHLRRVALDVPAVDVEAVAHVGRNPARGRVRVHEQAELLEDGEVVLGPSTGEPDPSRRTVMPVTYEGSTVGELQVDGELSEDLSLDAFLQQAQQYDEGGQGLERVRRPELGLGVAVHQLQILDGIFDVDDAARTVLDVGRAAFHQLLELALGLVGGVLGVVARLGELAHRLHDHSHGLGQRIPDLRVADLDHGRDATCQVASPDLHHRGAVQWGGGPELHLDVLGRALPDQEVMCPLEILDDRFVHLFARHSKRSAVGQAGQRDHGDVRRTAADIDVQHDAADFFRMRHCA